jgi:V/A-type H+-transporting ATPase subunit D
VTVALRLPPGRAGRLWLLHRIDAGRRGDEVLDQKRQALVREELRLRAEAAAAEAEWRRSAADARRWLGRAAVLGGERGLDLARFHAGGPAEIEVAWRSVLGVRQPVRARVLPPAGDAAALASAGTAALAPAAEAHRRALAAAARHAAASASHRRVAAELALTARRLRTIERRWLPEHEGALRRLDLRLDEEEREESGRIRWAADREGDGDRAARPPGRAPDGV